MALQKFTRTEVDVDALQWEKDASNTLEIIDTFFASLVCYDASKNEPKLHIATPDGIVVAEPGHWVGMTLTGAVYVMKPDVFSSIYAEKK